MSFEVIYALNDGNNYQMAKDKADMKAPPFVYQLYFWMKNVAGSLS
jgi:hypothetical protein